MSTTNATDYIPVKMEFVYKGNPRFSRSKPAIVETIDTDGDGRTILTMSQIVLEINEGRAAKAKLKKLEDRLAALEAAQGGER